MFVRSSFLYSPVLYPPLPPPPDWHLLGRSKRADGARTGGRVGIHALLELIITPLLLSFFLCLPLPAFLAHSPDTTLIYCVLWSVKVIVAFAFDFDAGQ